MIYIQNQYTFYGNLTINNNYYGGGAGGVQDPYLAGYRPYGGSRPVR
jgi:hypothetical protein